MNGELRDPAPPHDASRRLTGPNRDFPGPAVTLDPLGPATTDGAAVQGWAARVRAICAALGWPDPQPTARRAPDGSAEALSFAAPGQALLTATEIDEWAWERSADVFQPLVAQGFVALQPVAEDITAMAAHFARRAADELSRPLARLLAAAQAHGVPALLDDDSLTLGLGRGGRTWPRAALPLAQDVPWPALHPIPVVLVTGSNGKTTTTRLLAAIARRAGHHTGLCSTEGVWVQGRQTEGGDYAGPAGARVVLRHPEVDFAVLETARGGILRRGLALERADVAVVTNVSADHLGEYGIHGLADIAEAKLVVARALQSDAARPLGGTLVLNGGDAMLMQSADALPHARTPQRALFAGDAGHPALRAHRERGGRTCGAHDGRLWLQTGGATPVPLGEVASMPLTLGGAAVYNVENLAAAALAAQAMGLPVPAIASTLRHFGADPADNPGRLERHAWRGATVLLDYAHNPDGLARLLAVARAMLGAGGRLRLLLGQAGNRDDTALAELARTAAAARPDQVVVKELPGMLRGRQPGEVPALLEAGLLRAALPRGTVQRVDDEWAAAIALLDSAAPGDTVVLPVHTAATRARLGRVLSGDESRGQDFGLWT